MDIFRLGPDTPLVSIIIPVHNAQQYVAAAIRSALAQTYFNIEVIVVDDGSSDRSVEIAKALAALDPRVQVIQQPNGGAAAARNTAVAHSRGAFIAPLDADDVFDPRKIEVQMARFKGAEPQLALVYCWTQRIDEDGFIIDEVMEDRLSGSCFEELVITDPVGHGSGILIRRDVFIEVGGFDVEVCPKGSAGCEDHKLLLDVARKYTIDYIPEVLVGYRKTAGAATRQLEKMLGLHRKLLAMLKQTDPALPEHLFRRSYTKVVFWLITDPQKTGLIRKHAGLLIRALVNDPGFCLTRWFRDWFVNRIRMQFYQRPNDVTDIDDRRYMPFVYEPVDSARCMASKTLSASTL